MGRREGGREGWEGEREGGRDGKEGGREGGEGGREGNMSQSLLHNGDMESH